MVKGLKTAAALIFVSFLLTGCVGKEPNAIAYVAALGIDINENGNYKVTIQYANPTKISGGGGNDGGGDTEESGVENLTVEAPNIYAAVGLANQIESKEFSLSHTKLVVFSQEIAENGLNTLNDIFIRSEEMRPDVYLAVAAGGAQEYLEAVNPDIEINPAKYYQTVFNKNNVMGLPEGMQKNFFFGIETGDYDSLLPIAGVVQGGNGEENEKINEAPVNNEAFEYRMRDYLAGQNAINVGTKTEAIGSAVFKGDKMVGTLGSIDTELYKLMDRSYSSSYITLYNEQTPLHPVTIKTIQKKPPKYDIDTENKTFKVRLFLEGDIYSLPEGYNIEDDLDNFEHNCEKYIAEAAENMINEVLKNYDSDIFRLNERLKPKFLTHDNYKESTKKLAYGEFYPDVEVKFDIRRTGLIIEEG